MPWSRSDAWKHTKKANTPRKQRIWVNVANHSLRQYGDEARAVQTANGVIGRLTKKKAT